MFVTLVLVAAVALGWLACGVPLPAAASGRFHRRDPRLRWVERHPEQVNSGDIDRLLLAEGLSVAEVRLLAEKARHLGIRPFTMWLWTRRFDARSLALVIAADLTHLELLGHLAAGTRPDLDELMVFARLNGLRVAAA